MLFEYNYNLERLQPFVSIFRIVEWLTPFKSLTLSSVCSKAHTTQPEIAARFKDRSSYGWHHQNLFLSQTRSQWYSRAKRNIFTDFHIVLSLDREPFGVAGIVGNSSRVTQIFKWKGCVAITSERKVRPY